MTSPTGSQSALSPGLGGCFAERRTDLTWLVIAKPGPATAVALPLSGYTLWWDGTSWAISLIGFAGLPHVWWTMRRWPRHS